MSDRIAQAVAALMPRHLPKRMNAFHDRLEHYSILHKDGSGLAEARACFSALMPTIIGVMLERSPGEGRHAALQRFAVAGAVGRFCALLAARVGSILALDLALRRYDPDRIEEPPPESERQIETKLYCGHFFCHVFHQDHVVRKRTDCTALEHAMRHLLDKRGAEYPAEHSVGHLYKAKPALASFCKDIDPTNAVNPGLGQTRRPRDWQDPNQTSQGWIGSVRRQRS